MEKIPKEFFGLRVLLVEHDKNNLHFHACILSKHSYRVTSTSKASAALSLIANGATYDCVLADADMSEMDALEFLHEIFEHQPRLPVIMMASACNYMSITNEVAQNEAHKNEPILCLLKPCATKDICNIWKHVFQTQEGDSKAKSSEESDDVINVVTTSVNAKNENDGDRTKKKRAIKKSRVKWTPYLHGKFLEAFNNLGEQNAHPSAILRQMNMANLTRGQVASHLQKHKRSKNSNKNVRIVPELEADHSIKSPELPPFSSPFQENGLGDQLPPFSSLFQENNDESSWDIEMNQMIMELLDKDDVQLMNFPW